MAFELCDVPRNSDLAMRDFRTPFGAYGQELDNQNKVWSFLSTHPWAMESTARATTVRTFIRELQKSRDENPDVLLGWPESPFDHECDRRRALGILAMSELATRMMTVTTGLRPGPATKANFIIEIADPANQLPLGYKFHVLPELAQALVGSDEHGWYKDAESDLYLCVGSSRPSHRLLQELRSSSTYPDFPRMNEIEPHYATRPLS